MLEKKYNSEAFRIFLEKYPLKKMVGYQDEDDFNVYNEENLIDKMIYEKNDIRVRVKTMTII